MPKNNNEILNILMKDIKAFNGQIYETPIINKYDNVITRSDLNDEIYGEQLSKYIDYIIENANKEDLAIFYNNINNLKICYENNNIKGVRGSYDMMTNRLGIEKKDVDILDMILPHELAHASSSYYDKASGVAYSGFGQFYNNGKFIGWGLMEGYTQLFSERFRFPDMKELSDIEFANESYAFETLITSIIEKIVGQDKTKSLYLRADLMGLINELKRYASTKEIMKLISTVDYVYTSLMGGNNIPLNEGLTFINSVNDGVYFSRLLLLRKYKELYEHNKISHDNFKKQIDSFAENVEGNPFMAQESMDKIKSFALDLLKH